MIFCLRVGGAAFVVPAVLFFKPPLFSQADNKRPDLMDGWVLVRRGGCLKLACALVADCMPVCKQ